MELDQIQMLAGYASTMLFTSSKIPMLMKVVRTRDMHSYSLGHLSLSNLGNLIYWLYVVSLPPGPIWFLQAFFTAADVLMLLSFVRHELLAEGLSMVVTNSGASRRPRLFSWIQEWRHRWQGITCGRGLAFRTAQTALPSCQVA
jgi:hypothetical protein